MDETWVDEKYSLYRIQALVTFQVELELELMTLKLSGKTPDPVKVVELQTKIEWCSRAVDAIAEKKEEDGG